MENRFIKGKIMNPITAEAHNAPQVGKSELLKNSDDIRHKLMEQFEQFKPHLTGYHEYATRAAALAQEYHAARFKEVFPQIPMEELTLITTLDARETPKSLDTKLAQLTGIIPKRIIFDPTKFTYYLFL
jgi:hypothetical protein